MNTNNNNYSEVEKSSLALVPSSTSLGNSSLLLVEPYLCRTPLYLQVSQSYKWMAKVECISKLIHILLWKII